MNSPQYDHSQPGLLLEIVGDDQEMFLQLAEIFVRESAEKFQNMRIAMAASDFTQLGRQSHALKGTVGPLGADALVEELVKIEEECNASQFQRDDARLDALEVELNQVKRELQLFIANL